MIRTGIYGGSFNPIHLGHTLLGEALVKMGIVDEMWLLVSPQNPFKVNQSLLPDEDRLFLAELAVEGNKHLQVCDAEFHLPRPSYMVNTLKVLSNRHPERSFLLVIGADNWERFPQWYKSEEILRNHQLVIIPRPGYEVKDAPKNAIVASTPLYDISSTQIREAISNGTFDGAGLHPAVWKRIQQEGYYL